MLFSTSRKAKRRGERGNLVVITGVMAIPLSMIVVMTLEMVSLSSERARMQAAVDAAALAGARELAVAGGAARNASGFAEAFA
jgi:Flp pilus assembly protein TadG